MTEEKNAVRDIIVSALLVSGDFTDEESCGAESAPPRTPRSFPLPAFAALVARRERDLRDRVADERTSADGQ